MAIKTHSFLSYFVTRQSRGPFCGADFDSCAKVTADMEVCRLCSRTEGIVNVFHEKLENAEQLREIIFFTTGIHIREDDKITRMVCKRCCQIILKMYKYIKNAIANDKLLKLQAGLPYTPPNLDRILNLTASEDFLSVSTSSSSSSSSTADLCRKLYKNFHDSVLQLLKTYKTLNIPKEIFKCDISPVITVDRSEVTDWFKEQHQKLPKILIQAIPDTDQYSSAEDNDCQSDVAEDVDVVSTTLEAATVLQSNNNKADSNKSLQDYNLNTSQEKVPQDNVISGEAQKENQVPLVSSTQDLVKPTSKPYKSLLNGLKPVKVRKPKRKKFDDLEMEIIPKKKRIFANKDAQSTINKVELPVTCPVDVGQRKAIFTSSLELLPVNKTSSPSQDVVIQPLSEIPQPFQHLTFELARVAQKQSETNTAEIAYNIIPIQLAPRPAKRKMFKCQYCSKLFERRQQMKLHELTHPKCKLCYCRMPTKELLVKHERKNCLAGQSKLPTIALYRIDDDPIIRKRYLEVPDEHGADETPSLVCSEYIDFEYIDISQLTPQMISPFPTRPTCYASEDQNIIYVSDDDDVVEQGDANNKATEKTENEAEMLERLFKTYLRPAVSEKSSQTFSFRNVSFENGIFVLKTMLPELSLYTVPVHFKIAPTVSTGFTSHVKKQQNGGFECWVHKPLTGLRDPKDFNKKIISKNTALASLLFTSKKQASKSIRPIASKQNGSSRTNNGATSVVPSKKGSTSTTSVNHTQTGRPAYNLTNLNTSSSNPMQQYIPVNTRNSTVKVATANKQTVYANSTNVLANGTNQPIYATNSINTSQVQQTTTLLCQAFSNQVTSQGQQAIMYSTTSNLATPNNQSNHVNGQGQQAQMVMYSTTSNLGTASNQSSRVNSQGQQTQVIMYSATSNLGTPNNQSNHVNSQGQKAQAIMYSTASNLGTLSNPVNSQGQQAPIMYSTASNLETLNNQTSLVNSLGQQAQPIMYATTSNLATISNQVNSRVQQVQPIMYSTTSNLATLNNHTSPVNNQGQQAQPIMYSTPLNLTTLANKSSQVNTQVQQAQPIMYSATSNLGTLTSQTSLVNSQVQQAQPIVYSTPSNLTTLGNKSSQVNSHVQQAQPILYSTTSNLGTLNNQSNQVDSQMQQPPPIVYSTNSDLQTIRNQLQQSLIYANGLNFELPTKQIQPSEPGTSNQVQLDANQLSLYTPVAQSNTANVENRNVLPFAVPAQQQANFFPTTSTMIDGNNQQCLNYFDMIKSPTMSLVNTPNMAVPVQMTQTAQTNITQSVTYDTVMPNVVNNLPNTSSLTNGNPQPSSSNTSTTFTGMRVKVKNIEDLR